MWECDNAVMDLIKTIQQLSNYTIKQLNASLSGEKKNEKRKKQLPVFSCWLLEKTTNYKPKTTNYKQLHKSTKNKYLILF